MKTIQDQINEVQAALDANLPLERAAYERYNTADEARSAAGRDWSPLYQQRDRLYATMAVLQTMLKDQTQ